MNDLKLERLRTAEANAWRNYQEARRKAREKRTANRLEAVILTGEKWSDRNFDLHDYIDIHA